MKSKLKFILSSVLILAMIFSTLGIVVSADSVATVTITEEVVDAATGVKKLVFSGTTPAGAAVVDSAGIAFSFDNTVIQPVKENGDAVDVIDGTAKNKKAVFPVYEDDYYEFSLAPILGVAVGTRTGVLVDTYLEEKTDNYPGVDATSGMVFLEFYFKVVDGATPNSETFKIETTGEVFNKLQAPAGIMFGAYTYGDNTGKTDTLAYTLTYTGSEPAGKNKIDISNVAIADVTATYNGAAVVATVAVPEGVDATITYNTEDEKAPVNAGTYTATVSLAVTDAENTELTGTAKDLEATITIDKKDATFTVKSETIAEGAEIPEFTGSFEGLVGSDTVAVTYTCEATKESAPGEYTITATGENANYNINFVPGTLTITKVDPTKAVLDTTIKGEATVKVDGKIFKDLYKVVANVTVGDEFVGKKVTKYGVSFRGTKGTENVGGNEVVFTPTTVITLGSGATLDFAAAITGVPEGATVTAVPFIYYK